MEFFDINIVYRAELAKHAQQIELTELKKKIPKLLSDKKIYQFYKTFY